MTASPVGREDLTLPIEAPRADWPALLNKAADALQGWRKVDPETLALELRAISAALHKELNP